MRQDLHHSQHELYESLFELYIQGDCDLFFADIRGQKRFLIIDLEASDLTPEKLK